MIPTTKIQSDGARLSHIGVVYLCRCAEGAGPVRTFVESYRAHAAGADHDLHVIFKGFTGKAALGSAAALFAGLPIHPIELTDTGYDIGSYFAAASEVANRRLIFFNTFSVLLADDWLKKFDDALSLPGVGLVGATGSWQSHRSLYEQSLRYARHSMRHPLQYLRELQDDHSSPAAGRSPASIGAAGKSAKIDASRLYRRFATSLYRLVHFRHYLSQYAPFPNPHIRTNAFMIERDRLLSLKVSSFRTKFGVYKFESGWQSLTRQILDQALRPVVVDCDGAVYDIADWKASSTFWINGQVKLIAADNRTRDYSEGSQRMRERLQANAWQDPAGL